jgi:ferritin-like metal-binding protein YciE
MAEAGTLHDAFIDELRDMYDAERQLTKALPKLAKASTNESLRDAFESHLEETQAQIKRLEQVFEGLDEKARGKHCDGMAGIIEEGKAILEEDFDETTLDACLIASAQRSEHYEIAAYGTLVAWARAMGHDEAADLLQENLDEEKAADEKLTSSIRRMDFRPRSGRTPTAPARSTVGGRPSAARDGDTSDST